MQLLRRGVTPAVAYLRCSTALDWIPAANSGHSLRSGMATSAAAGGAPERAIMRQVRWASRAMVDRYVRHGTIWQECAAAYMGL